MNTILKLKLRPVGSDGGATVLLLADSTEDAERYAKTHNEEYVEGKMDAHYQLINISSTDID